MGARRAAGRVWSRLAGDPVRQVAGRRRTGRGVPARRPLGQRSDPQPLPGIQRGVGMMIWPPDDALGTEGRNETDVRLHDGGVEFDGNGAGFYDDRAGAGGAVLPDRSVVVDETTRADEMTRTDAVGEQARLVPAAVGRLLPVTDVTAPALVGRTAA